MRADTDLSDGEANEPSVPEQLIEIVALPVDEPVPPKRLLILYSFVHLFFCFCYFWSKRASPRTLSFKTAVHTRQLS